MKCQYCDNTATKTLVWLFDKKHRPARIRVQWCGCDLQTALEKFWKFPYTVFEHVDYEVEQILPKLVGYATIDGILHLYEDTDEFRETISDGSWSQAGWIKGVEIHHGPEK